MNKQILLFPFKSGCEIQVLVFHVVRTKNQIGSQQKALSPADAQLTPESKSVHKRGRKIMFADHVFFKFFS